MRLPSIQNLHRLHLFLFISSTMILTIDHRRLCDAHNITKILAEHPELSSFNHYLSATRLSVEINRRNTITVLAVDNAAMAELLGKHFTVPTLKNVLELHVLVDYYGAKKLHQLTGGSALSSSMFQATGSAPGTSGYVNISDHRAGLITFSAVDDTSAPIPTSDSPSTFVKSIKEIPYNLSVIQISSPLSSPAAEAPTPSPTPINISDTMRDQGCKLFSDLLAATGGVEKSFDSTVDGGLTVFCPIDDAVESFRPEFDNLTAEAKQSLLLYHGYPVYNSLQDLKSNNGLVPTLATDGTGKNFKFTVQNSGEVVQLLTKIDTATITKTLLDQDPCAIYAVDKVLRPPELFKKLAEAPAPEAEAPAPEVEKKKKKNKGNKAHEASPPASDGPDSSTEDDKTDDDNGVAAAGRLGWVVAVSAAAAVVTMVVF